MKKIFEAFSFEGAAKYRLCMLLPALLLVGIDQVLKYVVAAFLKGAPAVVLWDGVFELLYVENRGAAFSMLQNARWFFVILTTIVMIFLLLVVLSGRYRRSTLLNISFVLVIGGGIGNLIDRIVNGYVIDYLYFKLINFPVFNFADCCLVIGAVFMLAFFFFVYEDTSKSAPKPVKKETDNDNKHLGNT